MRRRIVGIAITALVAGLALTSCTTTVDGTPVPAKASGGQPAGEPPKQPRPPDLDPQAVTVALRQLDACAIVNLDAAKAAGNPKAALLPMGLHACLLSPTATCPPAGRDRRSRRHYEPLVYNGPPVIVAVALATNTSSSLPCKERAMHRQVLGEDPQWALYQHRERLDLTDPPVAAPARSHHLDVLCGVPAVISALAIIGMLTADTAPVTPPNLDTHGTTDTQTPTAPGHPINAPHHVIGPLHRHSAVSHHHLKEALR